MKYLLLSIAGVTMMYLISCANVTTETGSTNDSTNVDTIAAVDTVVEVDTTIAVDTIVVSPDSLELN